MTRRTPPVDRSRVRTQPARRRPSKVKTVDDVTLPAWTDRLRLSTGKPDGELSINQYSVVTEETVRKHLTRDVTFYDFTGIFAHPSMRTNIDYISSRDFDPDRGR